MLLLPHSFFITFSDIFYCFYSYSFYFLFVFLPLLFWCKNEHFVLVQMYKKRNQWAEYITLHYITWVCGVLKADLNDEAVTVFVCIIYVSVLMEGYQVNLLQLCVIEPKGHNVCMFCFVYSWKRTWTVKCVSPKSRNYSTNLTETLSQPSNHRSSLSILNYLNETFITWKAYCLSSGHTLQITASICYYNDYYDPWVSNWHHGFCMFPSINNTRHCDVIQLHTDFNKM